MTPRAKDQLPEGDREAIISTMVLFILDQLDQTVNAPDPHYQYLRAIFQRYPLHIVVMEIRNILASFYFPQEADLTHLVMQYSGITLVPQQRPGGYCTTFSYKEMLYSTPLTTTPLNSLEIAQQMVDQLLAGVQLPSSAMEEPVEQKDVRRQKGTEPTSPPAPMEEPAEVSSTADAQMPPAFIRIGRIAFAIDKILYVKDDSSERYQSVRVGLAGGVDMRLDANPSHNYIHTQEVRFIGEEARALLAWHQRWTLTLPTMPDSQGGELNQER